MDNSQLVTIAVTAIITAFVKEIAGALFSISKNFASSTTVREKIKTALTPNKITAAINLFLMLFCIWSVYGYVYSSAPLDRFAVFNIAYFTGLAVLSLARIDMVIMIHNESTSQLRLLPARIRLEIARLEKEQHDAAQAEALSEAWERLDEAVKRSKDYLDKDRKTLPPEPPENVQR